MSHNKALDNLTREQLVELLEIYAKNWLAADGIWFQSVEKRWGMEEAMYHDVEIWSCHSGFMPTLTTTRSVLKGTRCFIAWLIVAYKRQGNERGWNFIPAKQWG